MQMRLYKFENREIRSFRMRERTLRMKTLVDSNARTACFIMSDAIQPEERTDLRESLLQHNLKLTVISKKVINILMQNSVWDPLKELLKGNVATLEPINKETGQPLYFNVEKLQFVMLRDIDLFSIRLFIENQKVYRKEKIQTFLSRSTDGQNFKTSVSTEGLSAPLVQGSFGAEFSFMKTNYTHNQV